ncbi:MAG: hypothetical protein PHE70_03130 [Tepidanaerobacteraceae bacterium]|nr:hypothetical protein [Tepidanaerobacteraceae bacterium]
MTIENKDLWSIFLALFSAFIVYQFGRRSKGMDSFLDSLIRSYENVYYPIYIILKKIDRVRSDESEQLITDFFKEYSLPDSSLKLIASTFILEWYFDLEQKYINLLKNTNEINRSEFWKSFDSFYIMIEDEFWQAHDIIYKDYYKFKSLVYKNPFLKMLMEISIFFYNVTLFVVYVAMTIVVVSIYNYFIPITIFPKWWKIHYGILILMVAFILYGFALILSSWYVSNQNKRKSKLTKKINNCIEKYLCNLMLYISNIGKRFKKK